MTLAFIIALSTLTGCVVLTSLTIALIQRRRRRNIMIELPEGYESPVRLDLTEYRL